MTTCAGCDAAEGLTTMGGKSWCRECCPQAFCPNCLTATGGVCPKHQEPECTCYEVTGGHMVGCAFNRAPPAPMGAAFLGLNPPEVKAELPHVLGSSLWPVKHVPGCQCETCEPLPPEVAALFFDEPGPGVPTLLTCGLCGNKHREPSACLGPVPERSKEWWMEKARLEEGHEVGVGGGEGPEVIICLEKGHPVSIGDAAGGFERMRKIGWGHAPGQVLLRYVPLSRLVAAESALNEAETVSPARVADLEETILKLRAELSDTQARVGTPPPEGGWFYSHTKWCSMCASAEVPPIDCCHTGANACSADHTIKKLREELETARGMVEVSQKHDRAACARADRAEKALGAARGNLTMEQAEAACLNFGIDLTCGACAAQFYTGAAPYVHNPTCKTRGPANNEKVKDIIRALLIASVGRCVYGDSAESATPDDSTRCREPAVYGIITGWYCPAHRDERHKNVIGDDVTKRAMALLYGEDT